MAAINYIRFPSPQLDAWEFYDLKNDPQELENVYGDETLSREQKRMKEELERLQRQYKIKK